MSPERRQEIERLVGELRWGQQNQRTVYPVDTALIDTWTALDEAEEAKRQTDKVIATTMSEVAVQVARLQQERDALVGIVLATKIRLAIDAAKYALNSLELPEGVEVTTNLGRLDMEAERKQREVIEVYDEWQRTGEA